MRIPHAIFTSLRGERLEGYQLAATSEEVTEELARELNTWGPAHDSLLDEHSLEPSVNFHPLSADYYCLSVTRSAGAEYSGRAGGRIYTQMFLLSPEALARFGNNPFLIRRAIQAAGRELVLAEPPSRLRSFPLVGRAGDSDAEDSEQLLEQVSPEVLQKLAKMVVENPAVALAAQDPLPALFAALFQRLTPEQRLQVSFTTGLRHSPRRPFRLFVLPWDPAVRRQFQRQVGVTVVELEAAKDKNVAVLQTS
jgi:hypothetical protein